jgi:uncharacterized protein YdhG (YjbR/CyaY superfamily)
MAMKSTQKTATERAVDDYLAMLPESSRTVLKRVRRTIRVAAPKAVEKISYRMPMYSYLGMLVGFAAFKNPCSLFIGPSVIEAHKDLLKHYDTSKGTIRFTIDKPLPVTLVKKLVKARIKENETKFRKRRMKSHPAQRAKRLIRSR